MREARSKLIYLDHQASTPMHPAAVTAMMVSITDHPANPHAADHAAGWAAANSVDVARANVAVAICCDPDEIVFTSGATEADNLALLGVAGASPARRRIVVGAMEHKAVLGPARELARRGFEVVLAPATREGVIDGDALAALIDERTLLVSLMLVNNEVGTVQPVEAAARACGSTGAMLHVDAAQAFGWMPIDAHALGADLLSVSAHKMGGPKGIGALFLHREVRERVRPIVHGGEQEDGLRPGTLPTPLCAAFGAACRSLPAEGEVASWRACAAKLERALLELFPAAWVNGAGAERHPGCVSLTIPDVDAGMLVARLQPEVAVSRGSACTSGTPEPSHVLRAMGLTAKECEGTLRLSVGRFTSDAEIKETIRLFEASAMLI